MHHKRRRHKAARAGCLLCKPNKRGAGMEFKAGRNFGQNVYRELLARIDMATA